MKESKGFDGEFFAFSTNKVIISAAMEIQVRAKGTRQVSVIYVNLKRRRLTAFIKF